MADCAEPKSIAEVRNEGLNVVASSKGRDSIRTGIDIMRRYRINIVRPSVGMIREFSSYKWKRDRNGDDMNEPTDMFNHAIDATRYVCLAYLMARRRGAPRAHNIPL